MTLWLDAHLSPRLAQWITEKFAIPATPLRDLGLRDAEDFRIWRAAATADVILMTKDSDFADTVRRLGPPPHILWLTCGNTSEMRLKQLLEMQFRPALELIKAGEPLVEIR
jgi:predicted nuclease of predicted toxin-antitoxin system